jgi:ubiquitin-protein ligase
MSLSGKLRAAEKDLKIVKEYKNLINDIEFIVDWNWQFIDIINLTEDKIYNVQVKMRLKSYNVDIFFKPEYPFMPPRVVFLEPIPNHELIAKNTGTLMTSMLSENWMCGLGLKGLLIHISTVLLSC